MTATGQELRAEGTQAVLAADTAPHRGYADLVRDAIDTLAASGRQFTAEDVRELITRDHPEAVAHSPNVLPAVFGAAAHAGRITAVGMAKPTRASRRHSRILTWVDRHHLRAAQPSRRGRGMTTRGPAPKPDTPEYWAMVKRVVDKAPPFTEQQKRRLRLLMRPIDAKYRGQKPAA